MKNQWNLDILFRDESAWLAALESLPGRVQEIRRGMQRPGSSRAEELETWMRELEEMIRLSSHAEIWLSRQIAIDPLNPHWAEMSDHLDRMEAGEQPLMQEIQRMLQGVPDLEKELERTAYLRMLTPYILRQRDRIIPLETLGNEKGDGWYRLQSMMQEAFVEYRGERVTFPELQEENGYAEWGEPMHPCTYDLYRLFYEKYGERAAAILLDGLKRDEADYQSVGADSLAVYLRDYGMSEEALQALTAAVERSLPVWYECKRRLDLLHSAMVGGEEEACEDASEETSPEGNVCEEVLPAEEEMDSETSDEAAYHTLYEAMKEQFADFHPAYMETLERSFREHWVWINDDPLAFMNQHASMIPELGLTYVSLAAECHLPSAAHELGHAWYNACVRGQNVLYNTNELLLELPANLAALWSYRWSIEHAQDTLHRLMESEVPDWVVDTYRKRIESPLIYEDQIGETITNIYEGTAAFLFEKELRSRVLEESLTASDLAEMSLRYRSMLLMPEHRAWKLDPMKWIESYSLFTCRCYYNLPYLISMLLAYRILEDYDRCEGEREQEDFWKRLTGFFRQMNVLSMEELLSEYLGEDIRRVEFWERCLQSAIPEEYHSSN